jgi:hypothetical protein
VKRFEIDIFSPVKKIPQMEDSLDVVFLHVWKQLFREELKEVIKNYARIILEPKVGVVKNY